MSKQLVQTIFSDDALSTVSDPSIFLAGPTPRSIEVISWRPYAVDYLSEIGFVGTVCIPERKDWSIKFEYSDQIEWELTNLASCSVVAFWVPRNMLTLPGLTTNVEFGLLVKSGRMVYGRPDGADHISYLDYLYRKFCGQEPAKSLKDLMVVASDKAMEKK